MRHADVIIPRGADNLVAIDLITKHIARQLDDRGFSFRSKMTGFARLYGQQGAVSLENLPKSVVVMHMTPQLKVRVAPYRPTAFDSDFLVVHSHHGSRPRYLSR
jgi:hypothetical protein